MLYYPSQKVNSCWLQDFGSQVTSRNQGPFSKQEQEPRYLFLISYWTICFSIVWVRVRKYCLTAINRLPSANQQVAA